MRNPGAQESLSNCFSSAIGNWYGLRPMGKPIDTGKDVDTAIGWQEGANQINMNMVKSDMELQKWLVVLLYAGGFSISGI